MESQINVLNRQSILIRNILFDIAAVTLIIFTPAFSHLTAIPIWMIEPMRILVILALLHTRSANAFALALILPFTSWLTSGHPELIKMVIITAELLANAFIFLLIKQMFQNLFLSVLVSIVASKIFCYLLYLIVFPISFFISESEPDFLLVQIVLSFVLAGYGFMTGMKKTN
ncbi:MAG: hypothetical protein V2A54_05095 [Bacteroidota bacterium]